jgi:hypothetical protein
MMDQMQTQFDSNRVDLLRLLLVLCSESMYEEPIEASRRVGACVRHLTSNKNRHCLALFTSLLNTVLGFEPTKSGYFSFMSGSSGSSNQSSATTSGLSYAEQLMETSLQVLIVCLDQQQEEHSNVSPSAVARFSKIKTKSFRRTESCTESLCDSPTLSHSDSIDSNENIRNPHCANKVCSSTANLEQSCGFNADSSGPPSPASIQSPSAKSDQVKPPNSYDAVDDGSACNLFVNYLARIHRDDDLQFVLNGFVRLLGQPLASTYLPSAARRLQAHQELLILFWRFCDLNKKFLYHALKSSQVLDVLVPVLWHLNESKSDPARLGLVHIGVFIILLLSGERNFGVRLNKPFRGCSIAFRQLPIFSGSHADLLVIVFHRLATAGSAKLQPLFECLLTILVNVSPYLKSLSMVSAHKLLHLFEAFCTPWFLYCNESNHHLVFYLLEIFNNIVQYQFDGNSNLVYTLIRKRHCFHQLANLPSDGHFISQSLVSRNSSDEDAVNDTVQKMPTNSQSAVNISTKTSDQTRDLLCDELAVQSANRSLPNTPEVEHNPLPTPIVNKSVTIAARQWRPTPEWVASWKHKLPLQTIMRMLQVLVPQVEKMCLDKGMRIRLH